MSETHSLKSVAIFQGLSDEALAKIAGQCDWRRFMAGQEIISHHDGSLDVYFLVEGRARIIIYSFSGKPVIFRDARPGEVFGEFAAIDQLPRSATVEATTDCLTAAIKPQPFMDVLLTHPEVAGNTMRWLVAQARALTGRVLEFSTLAVRNRLHAELLRLAKEDIRENGSAVISALPTHADLASRISTHREAVTREMRRLTLSGMIEKKGESTIICDVQEFSKLVEEVLGESLLDMDGGL